MDALRYHSGFILVGKWGIPTFGSAEGGKTPTSFHLLFRHPAFSLSTLIRHNSSKGPAASLFLKNVLKSPLNAQLRMPPIIASFSTPEGTFGTFRGSMFSIKTRRIKAAAPRKDLN